MTNEDATNKLVDIIVQNTQIGVLVYDEVEAITMGILALEKQIPKKPKLEGGLDVCPCCGGERLHSEEWYDEEPYCPDCGQAIDWSDDND